MRKKSEVHNSYTPIRLRFRFKSSNSPLCFSSNPLTPNICCSSHSCRRYPRFQTYLRINIAQPNPNYREATDFILTNAHSLSLEPQFIEFVNGKPLIILKWLGKDVLLPSIMLYSHTDVVPVEHAKWSHPPFEAHLYGDGRIYARGAQDMKCVGMQHLEAIRKLKRSGFEPLRTVYVIFVADEEIGGHDGAEKLAESEVFQKMNVVVVLDEGLASENENYRPFYAKRCAWWLVIGTPGHGANLYDNR